MNLPKYPFEHPNVVLIENNKAVWKHNFGHLCGYFAIPKSDLPEHWTYYGNADNLQEITSHGGITYWEEEDGIVVIGFDCAHYGDDKNNLLKDPKYIMTLVRELERYVLQNMLNMF